MSERNITKNEQSCISSCITRYWGNPDNKDDDEKRNRDYEHCLTDCRICGQTTIYPVEKAVLQTAFFPSMR